MKISVASLLDEQILRVTESYDAQTIDVNFIDFKYLDPIQMSGTVEKANNLITFQGNLVSRLEQMCGRCLETQTQPVDKSFQLFYPLENQTEIETIDDLREILIMDHPMAFLCSEKCKGLCHNCGANLNLAACKCASKNQPESLSSWQLAWKKKSGGKGHGKSKT